MEKENIHTALLAAQKKLTPIKKDATNPHFKNEYTTLESVIEEARGVLHPNNIYFTQLPVTEEDRIGIKTVFVHAPSSTQIESTFTVALDRNNAQGAGSALTYCKRYALKAMLGMSDEDDDGNEASKPTNTLHGSEVLKSLRR